MELAKCWRDRKGGGRSVSYERGQLEEDGHSRVIVYDDTGKERGASREAEGAT